MTVSVEISELILSVRHCRIAGCWEIVSGNEVTCPTHKTTIEARKQARIAAGRCAYTTKCDEPQDEGKTVCKSHLQHLSMQGWKLTIEAHNAYGGKCVCCGESKHEYLELDHINNNGAEERRNSGIRGIGYYRYLRRLGYPKDAGLQVLCGNCHNAKTKEMECHGRYWT